MEAQNGEIGQLLHAHFLLQPHTAESQGEGGVNGEASPLNEVGGLDYYMKLDVFSAEYSLLL